MRFKVNRADLLFELKDAAATISAKNVTSAISITEAGEDLILLRSVDLEQQLYMESEVSVTELDPRAPIAWKVERLRKVLESLDGDEVEMSNHGLSGVIECGAFKAAGLDAFGVDDFPEPQGVAIPEVLKVSRAQLSRCVKKALHSAEKSKFDHCLIVRLGKDGNLSVSANKRGTQVVVAGFAIGDGAAEVEGYGLFEAVVNPDNLRKAVEMPGGDEMELSASPSFLAVSSPGGWRRMYLRRVEGNWPDYRANILKATEGPSVTWEGQREALLALLWRLEAVAGAEAVVDLRTSPEGALGARAGGELTQARDEMAGEGSAAFDARLNLTNLANAVKSCDETVQLAFYPNDGKPFLRVVDPDHGDDLEVLMCMK